MAGPAGGRVPAIHVFSPCGPATRGPPSNPHISPDIRVIRDQRRAVAAPADAAALDDVMAVGKPGEGLQILVDEEDRLARLLELQQHAPDLVADERRQALRRLVE